MKRISKFTVLMGVFVLLLLCGPTAEASIVTFEFTGELDSVHAYYSSDLYPDVTEEDTFLWRVSYDTEMTEDPSTLGQDSWGHYAFSTSYPLQMGPYLISTDDYSKALNVWDGFGITPSDGFSIMASKSVGQMVYSLFIIIRSSEDLLDSDRPLSEVIDIASADLANQFYFSLRYSDDPTTELSGHVTSMRKIESSTVPESTTLLLFGSGLVGAFIRRRR